MPRPHVKITVINLDTGEVEREFTDLEWLSEASRDLLIRLGMWAFNNNRGVQMMNVNAKEPPYEAISQANAPSREASS